MGNSDKLPVSAVATELVKKRSERGKQLSGGLSSRTPSLRHDLQGRELMAKRLYQMFETFGQYGASQETMTSRVQVFSRALADYTADQINAAMAKWEQIGKQMPVPADIRELIEAGRPADDWTRGMRNATQERWTEEREREAEENGEQ